MPAAPKMPGAPPPPPPGGGGPPMGGPPAPPGGGGKTVNLGVPMGGGPGPGPLAFPQAPPGGGGGEGPQAPETGGTQDMDFPQLHVGDLDEGSGLEDLPEEGHARIHYKVTDKGTHHDKKSKKKKHHATLEVHHITPESSGSKESEADTIRNKAKKFFEAEDQTGGGPAPGEGKEPTSQMPG
jgi:hypothetical protein